MDVKHLTFWEQQEMFCDFDEEAPSEATHVPQTHISQIRKNSSEIESKRNPFEKNKDVHDESKPQLFDNFNDEGLNRKSKSLGHSHNTSQLASKFIKDNTKAQEIRCNPSFSNDVMENSISNKIPLKKH
jgi:hypothetical protein